MIELMSKRYDKTTYHCVHFAVDAWKKITGQDLSEQFAPILTPLDQLIPEKDLWDGFEEIQRPLSPCLVLMRSGTAEPHMGVYDCGRVLHLRETGPHFAVVPQLVREYPQMRFFKCTK